MIDGHYLRVLKQLLLVLPESSARQSIEPWLSKGKFAPEAKSDDYNADLIKT